MKPYTTSQRLRQIMDERNIRQADIVRAAQPFCQQYGVNLGKNTLSQYVSGKTEPGQEKLTILGLTLNVSEAWLMGYDVSPERENTPIAETSNERVAEFANLFSLLTDDQQEVIIHAIKGILSGR